MEKSGRLDLDSSEVNGTANKEPVVQATYKKLPEEDANWQSKTDQETDGKVQDTKMVKQNGAEHEVDDEAQERMLQDDAKLTPKKDATEVKFISENGDAKIDIEAVKQVLSGMGKEELMKFANDPFWIRLRWFLFIAFWFLWASMLAGAIAIIVMAPRCSTPEPRKWWQESPIVQLDGSETPSGNLKGLETLLDTIKEQGIKTISLASMVESSKDGHPINFRGIKSNLGTLTDLEAFIKAANSRGQHVVLELDPNHSSVEHPWFKSSVNREGNFTNYYVWADPKIENGEKRPPNNWLSVYGVSAWELNEARGQYYLHQFNKTQPELNYNNHEVVEAFGNILDHWLRLGVEGFRLENIRFLTEDPQLQNEMSHSNGAPGSYESLNHVRTRDRVENGVILRKWRNIVHNITKREGLFALCDEIGADMLQVYNNDDKKEGPLIDLSQSSQFLANAGAGISAEALNKSVSQNLLINEWPAWDLNGKSRSLRARVSPQVADSLTLMTLLLSGTPIVRYSDATAAKAAFAEVTKKRTAPAFLFGDIKTHIINNTQVFAYTRLKSGNPGFLVAYNSGNNSTIVDFTSVPHMAKEVTVVAHSPNYVVGGSDTTKTKLNSEKVPMAPKSTLVVSFVPGSGN
ncbi:neutral and basic amino acid transport protein rBAT isoform X2 [Belonocnema kinseyi]|uniref:neutral and basic amino acid transport protein rBAT isoform X2 n=1 Tax=Belonocnema kinseyi TaxID=2817044 RepID=UPI00143D43C1|nr:neutral and basic amino acid transport protein rBAT isoform X2 [Belonocnema kinseyi]